MRASFFLLCLLLAVAYPRPAPSVDARYWQAPVDDAPTIRAVQRALRQDGYDTGPADGTLSAKTVHALKQAQEERGLEPTGRLDRRTVAALGINLGAPSLHERSLELHVR